MRTATQYWVMAGSSLDGPMTREEAEARIISVAAAGAEETIRLIAGREVAFTVDTQPRISFEREPRGTERTAPMAPQPVKLKKDGTPARRPGRPRKNGTTTAHA